MKNINTPEYWDKQFADEYEVICGRKEGYHRWNMGRLFFTSEEIKKIGKVLDVSCGLGHMVRFLKARFPKSDIYGCDFSSFAIEKCKELSNDTFFISDCYSFYKQHKDFDYIVCNETIEHLDKPEKLLEAIKKGLKIGGKCIITTPIKGFYPKEPDHVREFFQSEMTEMMNKYFSDVRLADFSPHQLLIGTKE